MNLFDEQTEDFSPTVHSTQISIPFDEKKVPKWIKDQLGLRHQSASYLSLLTNSLMAVVSEQHGSLRFYRSGEEVKNIAVDNFIQVLRTLLLNAMTKQLVRRNPCNQASPPLEETSFGEVPVGRAWTNKIAYWRQRLDISPTQAVRYVSTFCTVMPCTAMYLEEIRDWFVFNFVEARKQFHRSPGYLRHDGVLELPESASRMLESDTSASILSDIEGKVNRDLEVYGAFIQLDREDRQVTLFEDPSRIPGFDTDYHKGIMVAGLHNKFVKCAGMFYALDKNEHIVRWVSSQQATKEELSKAADRLEKEAVDELETLKNDGKHSCYVLQYGSTRLGGFSLTHYDNIVVVNSSFMPRDCLHGDYFVRLLLAFFRRQRWTDRDLMCCPNPPISTEKTVYSIWRDFFWKYGPQYRL